MRPGYVYAEEDWNPVTKETAASGGGVIAYLTSKTFAEQAAWNYVKDNRPNFDVTTLLPPLVYGPVIHHKEVPDTSFWALADVQDVAEAHVRALEESAAAGQRYLIANSAYSYQQVCDIIRENFPQFHNLTPRGTPGARLPPVYKLDTSKAVHQLGMSFRPREETIVDTVESLRELHQ
ncbi:methylglyoxal reductase (NADPH-dependent) gre2 [Purpureocillium lilacinum]|uniref:methylglyoxal reductase (NADPH-dependent) gre2 n=1 Tax=Purpureocillium lilacinum TaxID=33203 RepID=UPI00208216D4|nr:methylglyoxal reductase (NADPH-dependent) gre2 [Purpureocillium lilacinum]